MSAWQITELAATGEQFTSFAPYVAAATSGGALFQARLADGSTAVVRASGGGCEVVARDPAIAVVSHPVEHDGAVYYYGERAGRRSLYRAREPLHPQLDAGPLGPTADPDGVAFRATAEGRPGIYLHRDGELVTIDVGRDEYFGIPVADRGSVVFRARHRDVHGVYRWRDGQCQNVVEGGAELGHFPTVGGGQVAYVDQRAVVRDGEQVVSLADGFESLRGAVLDDRRLWFLASEPSRELAIYDWQRQRMVAVGDRYAGQIITELAANSVSVGAGRLLLRLSLGDGSGRIVGLERVE